MKQEEKSYGTYVQPEISNSAEKRITIHTDGACEPNPGPGAWAAVIQLPSGEIREMSGRVEPTTNNRMEILACVIALNSLPENSVVDVFTDSLYVKNGITQWIKKWKSRNWGLQQKKGQERKPVKNKDLWLMLDDANRRHSVRWHWCRGHDGNEMNERADTLAAQALFCDPKFRTVNASAHQQPAGEQPQQPTVPLSDVDFSTEEERGQLNMFENECERMCGV